MSTRIAGLAVCVGLMDGVQNKKSDDQLCVLKKAAYAEVKERYSLEALKDNQTIRAYRNFYWRLGIDPTKTRPSGEALLRRVLNGNDLPSISAIVDAYNLASMKTIVPISGLDRDTLNPPFQVRFAANNEVFKGIGMAVPTALSDRLLVLADRKRVLCIYPHRDSDETKITLMTRNVMLVGYGAPGVAVDQLKEAVETALLYISNVAGGDAEEVLVCSPFSAS